MNPCPHTTTAASSEPLHTSHPPCVGRAGGREGGRGGGGRGTGRVGEQRRGGDGPTNRNGGPKKVFFLVLVWELTEMEGRGIWGELVHLQSGILTLRSLCRDLGDQVKKR